QTRLDQTRLHDQIPTVAIIMSTYNGEKYIREQIDSVLAQERVHIELFIRDDGSSDGTRDIISEYAGRFGNIHADFGINLGYIRSFFTELTVAKGFSYYALCDQDDVWKPEKLITAVNAIKHEEELNGKDFPVVWHSSLALTDSNLNVLSIRQMDKRIASLESFMVWLHGRGCAMVFNESVYKLTLRVNSLGLVHASHDLITVAVTYAFGGTVIFSPYAYVLYRQHSNNTSHAPATLFQSAKNVVASVYGLNCRNTRFAAELLRAVGNEVSSSIRKTLNTVSRHKHNLMYRLKIVLSPKFRTGDFRLTLAGKIKALLGGL
ncbi:MAG: glycosyltransferase, partial [Synergistaceae bacterium]|nr:glycosyltransferase [Synergistaceae bacterium]